MAHAVGVNKTDMSKLWVLVVLRPAAKIIPCFFIFLIPEANSIDKEIAALSERLDAQVSARMYVCMYVCMYVYM